MTTFYGVIDASEGKKGIRFVSRPGDVPLRGADFLGGGEMTSGTTKGVPESILKQFNAFVERYNAEYERRQRGTRKRS
jgi:hypothetical protein